MELRRVRSLAAARLPRPARPGQRGAFVRRRDLTARSLPARAQRGWQRKELYVVCMRAARVRLFVCVCVCAAD